MYLFYLDESGEREYTSPNRYFELCALGIQDNQWKEINQATEDLKEEYFDDSSVEIKSNWLRIPKERQKHYLQPYDLTGDDLEEFVEQLYAILLERDVVIISAVVDKDQMEEKYFSPQSPNSLAYRFIFERLEMCTNRSSHDHNVVIFDKITKKLLADKGYENILTKQHTKYRKKGTGFLDNPNATVEDLLFIRSDKNHLIQLADLCSYNIYRQFREHGDEWDDLGWFFSEYEYYSKIKSKIHSDGSGNLNGYGIKKFPQSEEEEKS